MMANSPATALPLACRLCSPSAVSSAKLDPAHHATAAQQSKVPQSDCRQSC